MSSELRCKCGHNWTPRVSQENLKSKSKRRRCARCNRYLDIQRKPQASKKIPTREYIANHPGYLPVLAALGKAPGNRSQVAKRSGTSPASVTRYVDHLLKRELLMKDGRHRVKLNEQAILALLGAYLVGRLKLTEKENRVQVKDDLNMKGLVENEVKVTKKFLDSYVQIEPMQYKAQTHILTASLTTPWMKNFARAYFQSLFHALHEAHSIFEQRDLSLVDVFDGTIAALANVQILEDAAREELDELLRRRDEVAAKIFSRPKPLPRERHPLLVKLNFLNEILHPYQQVLSSEQLVLLPWVTFSQQLQRARKQRDEVPMARFCINALLQHPPTSPS